MTSASRFARGLLHLVDELKDAGVPLHAVGLQSHLQPRYPHDPARFPEFVHALAGRGVDIYLTEFDVRDDTLPDDIAARDAMIAETAEKFLNNVLRVPAVKVVIARELADNYSFYTDARKEEGSARGAAAAAAAVRFVDAEEAALVCDGARLREYQEAVGRNRMTAHASRMLGAWADMA